MKKTPPSYALFRFYLISLSLLATLCYVIYFNDLYHRRTHASVDFFQDIRRSLNFHAKTQVITQPLIEDVLANYSDNFSVSYKIMVITPLDQSLIYSNRTKAHKDIELFTLPYWQPQYNKPYFYNTNRKELIGWMQLQNGYQAYIQVLHQPLAIQWWHPLFWLPALTLSALLIISIYYLSKYKSAWRQLIDYGNQFPISLNEPYHPITHPNIEIGQEFQRLGNTLNRINQQMHKAHRRNASLLKRLQRLTDYASLPLLIIGRSGQITFFNRRFEQSFMTAFQENHSYYVTDFLTGKDKYTQQLLTKIGELKVAKTITVSSIENNKDYLLSLQPITGNHGQLQGFHALLTDISQYINQLKTIDIKVQQQADKLIEFNQMWSVLGHELRTPLSGIIGLLELMPQSNFNAEQQETYHTLVQTSQSMLHMLNDMLDVAKMDAGKLQISIERVDVFEVCHQLVDLMASNARKQGIELLIRFDPQTPRYIDTDVGRLRQALMNLLGNAIKFTQEGFVALDVRFFSANDDKIRTMISEVAYSTSLQKQRSWLCFTVKDTGIGIAESDKAKLFSHFNQANESISRQFGGTGLGLAISNNFAQFLGGFIHVHSVVGEGSEFSLCLPHQNTSYQPIFQFNQSLPSICIIAFCHHAFSTQTFRQLANFLDVACLTYTNLNQTTLTNLMGHSFDDIAPVIIMDYELYVSENQPHINTLFSTPALMEAPKILLSMTPKSALTSEQTAQFDSIIQQPMNVSELVSELMRLSTQTIHKHTYQNKTYSKLESDYLAFMQTLDDHVAESDRTLPPLENPASTALVALKHSDDTPVILVAEDNAVNQKVVGKILQNLGYAHITVGNGEEAIAALQTHDISLILMDCRMPVMDGLQASEHIRAMQNSVPIVALTAGDTDMDKKACFDAGMNAFLSKPIKKEALEQILHKFMI